MNAKYEELREKYDTFVYDSYNIENLEDKIVITYNFEIVGLEKFSPKITVPKKDIKNYNDADINSDIFKNLVFNIGMVEVVSYLKATCSPNLVVNCGYLDKFQESWFKKLYINGLGEFFYRNDIKVDKENFLKIKSNKNLKNALEESKKELKGQLIPVGGGKDSNVTMEVLRDLREENTTFIVNARGATLESVKAGGYENDNIVVERTIDSRLLELNKKGFLNGHTPFSAMLAFLTTAVAYLAGKKYVVLSNESSANEPNVAGTDVNHQYSKSIEFENDFREYSKKYLMTGVEYFSLLRPLTELQIAALFSKYTKYHSVFKSCNVGSKENIWCGNCSKCLFVYIMLSNFLCRKDLVNIFGEEMFSKRELEKTFIELIGKGENKPFDCVGTYEEINYSLANTILKKLKKKEILPYLLERYFVRVCALDKSKLEEIVKGNEEKLLKGYEENNLPEKFDNMLKNELKVLGC